MEKSMFRHNDNDIRNTKMVLFESFRKENRCLIREATFKTESDLHLRKDSALINILP